MKKLSEVCKIVGVTRRTLQEYDKIGLLHPTDKTPAGYWLYDDVAIETLMNIQIFVECGYSRKQVKSILETFKNGEVQNAINICTNLISELEERRKRLDGMISTVKGIIKTMELPQEIQEVFLKVDWINFYKESGNFLSVLERLFSDTTEGDSENFDEGNIGIRFYAAIIAIGLCKESPCDSNEVLESIETLINVFLDMQDLMENNEDEYNEKLGREDVIDILNEIIDEILNDDQMGGMIELQCGEGSREYILKAVKMYCQKFKKETEK